MTVENKEKMNLKTLEKIAYIILSIGVFYAIVTMGWIFSENRNIITVMEILTVLSAIVIVWFMTELYKIANENQKNQSIIALILSACMATITAPNHFLYLTVLPRMYLHRKMPTWLLLDGWPSITKGLECVAWGFFLGLSMLFASNALHCLGSKAIVWTMRISGALTLAGLIGPITGNMSLYFLSTIGYSMGFLTLSIELLAYLAKKNIFPLS